MVQKWVILYGYGTKSAYVESTVDSRDRAVRALRLRRQSWGVNGSRFSMHPFNDVVERVAEDELILRGSAREPENTVPPLPPARARARIDHKFYERNRKR